ncbi:MAG: ester cyclase [Phaeodactylibacter sp.]|nr:ester cyclase [Phaeodactylibacter sp.]MCB9299900.1 ester cyclase [Lewinellaceae bacterium]
MNCKNLFTGVVVLLLLTAFSFTSSAQDCKQYQALIDKLDQAMSEKNADLLAEVYHDNAVRHTQEGDEAGIAKIKEKAAGFYANVPDAAGKNIDVICAGDRVVVRWLGSGTPKGSPKKIEVTGISIYKVEKGKIVEEWEEMNSLSLMMQMGYELKAPATN